MLGNFTNFKKASSLKLFITMQLLNSTALSWSIFYFLHMFF